MHGDIWPMLPGCSDLALPISRKLTLPTPAPNLPGIIIEPAGRPGIVFVHSNTHELFADPGSSATNLRPREGTRPAYLLLPEQDAENLRYILAHAWTWADAPEAPPARPVLIRILEGFELALDADRADLSITMPKVLPNAPAQPGDKPEYRRGRFEITTAAGTRQLAQIPGEAPHEIELRPRHPMWDPGQAATEAEFHQADNSRLPMVAPAEIATLPITVCDADRDWMHEKPWLGLDPPVGRQHYAPVLCHESAKFVLLGRGIEGMIADKHGVASEFGYLHSIATKGPPELIPNAGLRRHGSRIIADSAAIDAAPRLHGPHVVFYNGNISNYAHWLIDSLLQLHMMLPHLPKGTKLLLPGTLRALQHGPTRLIDHHATLSICGFDTLPAVEINTTICWADDLYWLKPSNILGIPAHAVQAFRRHMRHAQPRAAAPGQLIYIARRHTRRIANAEPLNLFLQRHGFATYYLEDLSFADQIALFAGAAWIIGPHGAEMANLLFCPPGTKIIELSPDAEFNPYFAALSSKLGLVHSVLPCPTGDGGFFGDMLVDVPKLASLYRMLKNRL